MTRSTNISATLETHFSYVVNLFTMWDNPPYIRWTRIKEDRKYIKDNSGINIWNIKDTYGLYWTCPLGVCRWRTGYMISQKIWVLIWIAYKTKVGLYLLQDDLRTRNFEVRWILLYIKNLNLPVNHKSWPSTSKKQQHLRILENYNGIPTNHSW